MATIIAGIVNAKSHADFKIPELSLQPKKTNYLYINPMQNKIEIKE